MSENFVSVETLIAQWRTMVANANREGPIPGDEIGHAARWTAVELCADELAAHLQAQAHATEKSPAWGIVNCHMLARRELRRLTQYTERDSTLPKTIERWQHIIRICELAGAKSPGVLRASLPTEITDGEEPPADPSLPRSVNYAICARCSHTKWSDRECLHCFGLGEVQAVTAPPAWQTLNAWREVGEEIERAFELMPTTMGANFPDWTLPRVKELLSRAASSAPPAQAPTDDEEENTSRVDGVPGVGHGDLPRNNRNEVVMTDENKSVWYGPHECSVCGVTIVKAAMEDGGAEFEPPARLMRAYRRGSEAFDVDLVYPMTWTPHVHVAVWAGVSPRGASPAAPDCPPSDAPVLP